MTVSGVRPYRGLVCEGVEEWATTHVITNKIISHIRALVTRTLKGNEKQFELAGVRVIGDN